MPLAAMVSSRVSRLQMLALLALPLTVPAAVFGARTGAGGWQLVPDKTSPLVRITDNRVIGLYPGVSKELILTLQSSDSKHSIVVRRVRVRDIATTNRSCAPARRNLAIRQYKGAPIRIPPGQARTVTVLLSMPSTVADACQWATFRLHYTAQARIGNGHARVKASQ
jgi:hypothetical protein